MTRTHLYSMAREQRIKIDFSCSFEVLSLFTVFQWENGLCRATSGEYGNCIAEDVCMSRRGILGGTCAEGLGICCVCMRIKNSKNKNTFFPLKSNLIH